MVSSYLFWKFIRKIFLSSSRLFNRIQNFKNIWIDRRSLFVLVIIFESRIRIRILNFSPFFEVDRRDGGSFAGSRFVWLFFERNEDVRLELIDAVQVVADDSSERNLPDFLQLRRSECARMVAVLVPKSISCCKTKHSLLKSIDAFEFKKGLQKF